MPVASRHRVSAATKTAVWGLFDPGSTPNRAAPHGPRVVRNHQNPPVRRQTPRYGHPGSARSPLPHERTNTQRFIPPLFLPGPPWESKSLPCNGLGRGLPLREALAPKSVSVCLIRSNTQRLNKSASPRKIRMPTELHFAAQSGDAVEVRRLVAAGASVNVQDRNGNTPLKYAAAEPHPDVLRLLISLGASPGLADHRGFTPIHCVAGHGFYEESIEMADILIKTGADVNARSTTHGCVPLHVVQTTKMIDFLLLGGADPTIKNDAGQTPEEYLAADGCVTEAKHLKKRTTEG